jgi:hypothetical protein
VNSQPLVIVKKKVPTCGGAGYCGKQILIIFFAKG